MAGGGNSFGESPGGKGRGQSEIGPFQKEERKKHRLRQFPAEIPVGIASHFFFLNLSKIVKPGYIYHLKFLLEASSSSPWDCHSLQGGRRGTHQNVCKQVKEVKALVAQLFLTLCNPMDCSLPGSRQDYWSGLPCPPPGHLPESGSPALQADSLPSEPPGKACKQVRGLYILKHVAKYWYCFFFFNPVLIQLYRIISNDRNFLLSQWGGQALLKEWDPGGWLSLKASFCCISNITSTISFPIFFYDISEGKTEVWNNVTKEVLWFPPRAGD